jgi:hypothetical protein
LPSTLVNWTPDGKGIVVKDREVFERKHFFPHKFGLMTHHRNIGGG